MILGHGGNIARVQYCRSRYNRTTSQRQLCSHISFFGTTVGAVSDLNEPRLTSHPVLLGRE